ncbi:MAG: ATP synthase F1 subunit delta [Alphaproteobacteria bacterium]
MSASAFDTHEVAKRYGKALLEITNEVNQLDRTIEDAQNLQELIAENEEFNQIVHSPLFTKEDQWSAIAKVLDVLEAGEPMKGFVQTLCENRRGFILDRALNAFTAQAEEYKGIQPVIVRSAKALTANQQENLRQALKKELGKEIRLDLIVEPSVKGGLSLEIGSKFIDNTLKTKLDRYHQAMKGDV